MRMARVQLVRRRAVRTMQEFFRGYRVRRKIWDVMVPMEVLKSGCAVLAKPCHDSKFDRYFIFVSNDATVLNFHPGKSRPKRVNSKTESIAFQDLEKIVVSTPSCLPAKISEDLIAAHCDGAYVTLTSLPVSQFRTKFRK